MLRDCAGGGGKEVGKSGGGGAARKAPRDKPFVKFSRGQCGGEALSKRGSVGSWPGLAQKVEEEKVTNKGGQCKSELLGGGVGDGNEWGRRVAVA